MRKHVRIALAACFLIISGVGVYLVSKDTPTYQPENNLTLLEEDPSPKGSYVGYEPSMVLGMNANVKRILFFYDAADGVSKKHDEAFVGAKIPDGIEVIKVDMNNDTALVRQFDVDESATFKLLNREGDEVRSWQSADVDSVEDLLAEVTRS